MNDFATKILALDDIGLRKLLQQLDVALELNENDINGPEQNFVGQLRATSNLAIAKLILLRALNSDFISIQENELTASNNTIRNVLENDPTVKFLTQTSYH
ncbi:hypothetical protein [Methylomonas sp. AM2-LC]|jgi:hypothetical protein|uniref:hypothetical protein n=1 Tax=Methylomonas sp. AM2-LC TaxID=3153301 RepID=UPI00326530B5